MNGKLIVVWLFCCLAFTSSQCPQPTPPARNTTHIPQPEQVPNSGSSSLHTPTPNTAVYPLDLKFDCAIRSMALEYAINAIQEVPHVLTVLKQVHNALNLTQCKEIGDTYSTLHQVLFRKQDNYIYPWDGAPVEYVVSPNGSDSNEGTSKSPWKTITRARDEIRKTPVEERKFTIVFLRNGTYYLDETVSFEFQDSGSSAGAPVAYVGFPHEKVVVSGARNLSLAWTRYRENVYVADVPEGMEFSSLFLDGERQILARYPNGDSSYPQPEGYIKAKGSPGYDTSEGTMVNVNTKVYNSKTGDLVTTGTVVPLYESHSLKVSSPMHHKGSCAYFEAFEGGALERFNTTYNKPLWNSRVKSAFFYDPMTWTKNTWAHPEKAVVHMFHPSYWGGWVFQVDSIDTSKNMINFSRGGFQEARGGTISNNYYFVENVMEELDAPGEFYLDTETHRLYVFSEKSPAGLTVEVPMLESLFQFRGSMQNVQLFGLALRHSIPTFLKSYESPPSGDWAIHRGGMVFIDGAENITIGECTFDQPSYNLIANNHMHGVGIYGKQTSMYFQAIAHHNTIRDNVMYRGPRAGVNFNDGFGGGNMLAGNLIFNMVRETWDHGPFNSWDRQIFYTKTSEGEYTTEPEINHITNNFMINRNYGPGHPNSDKLVDHDDGSSAYVDTDNVLIYGGIKIRDGNRRYPSGNLIVFAETHNSSFGIMPPYYLGPMGAQVHALYTESSDSISNNTVFLQGGVFINIRDGWNAMNFPKLEFNHYFTPGNSKTPFVVTGYNKTINTLEEWQREGFDKGSTISSNISTEEILKMARTQLGL